MSGITRRSAFWVAFALVSAASALLAWRYFPEALPLINLDVKMSRDQALEQAAAKPDFAPQVLELTATDISYGPVAASDVEATVAAALTCSTACAGAPERLTDEGTN